MKEDKQAKKQRKPGKEGMKEKANGK